MKKDKFIPEFKDIPRTRQEMPALPLEERLDNFQEVELERILSPKGPYGGFLIRPYDGEVPRKIAFILCVGCRDAEGGAGFCGTLCCQAAIGALLAAREQIPTLEAKVFYEDIRPMGPEGEEDYLRARQTSGIKFLRGKVKEVSEDSETKDLSVKYELGEEEREESFNLVVLSVGLGPSPDAPAFARRAGIKLGKFNFGGANLLTPLESSKAGIFMAGSFAGPTGASDALIQATAVAGKVAIQLNKEGNGGGGLPTFLTVYSDAQKVGAQGKGLHRRKVQAVLVIGGGISGMQAALDLAEQGIETFLVEREDELGGQVRKLYYLLGGEDPQAFLQGLIQKVTEHPRIRLFLGVRLAGLQGEAGDFQATLSQRDSQTIVRHGALIVATGGREAGLEESAVQIGRNEWNRHPAGLQAGSPYHLTQGEGEYEARLAQGETGGDTVVMIQCVGSSQQASPYCSRVCCSAAIKNALKTLQLNPKAKVYILYRDLRPNGLEEEYLAEAREKGVTFLPWSESPQLTVEEDGGVDLRVQEAARSEEVRLRPDLVVLSTAALPQPDSEALGTILGVKRNTHGFFQEKDGADRIL